MTLYDLRMTLCQLAQDLKTNDTWQQFTDNILRYGINVFYDRVLLARFLGEIQTTVDDRVLFDVFTDLTDKYSRQEIVNLVRAHA